MKNKLLLGILCTILSANVAMACPGKDKDKDHSLQATDCKCCKDKKDCKCGDCDKCKK